MKSNKNLIIIISLLILGFALIAVFFINNKHHITTENAVEIFADEMIPLSQAMANDNGFTCTGAVYDAYSNTFYVGDAGKNKPTDETFKAVIRQISNDFESQLQEIDCYSQFKALQDIQGVALDRNNNIWFCSHGENLIRGISESGSNIGMFDVKNPLGIAYSKSEDAFWILSDCFLMLYSKEGDKLKKYNFKVKGQDQLYLDNESNILYITAGIDYHGDSYIYTFDVDNEAFELKNILKDSYAIEGISIVKSKMYVFNDGFYHDAKIPINQVNIYILN